MVSHTDLSRETGLEKQRSWGLLPLLSFPEPSLLQGLGPFSWLPACKVPLLLQPCGPATACSLGIPAPFSSLTLAGSCSCLRAFAHAVTSACHALPSSHGCS